MKKINLKCLFSLLITVLLLSCSNVTETNDVNNITVENGSICFEFSSDSNEKERASSNVESDIVAVILSVSSDSTGNVLYEDLRRLNVYKWNGTNSYITEKLTLNQGTYYIQKFFAVDSQNNIIYATPLTSSDMKDTVPANTSLPRQISVNSNRVTTVVPQIIKIEDSFNIADLGYVLSDYKFWNINATFNVYVKARMYKTDNTYQSNVPAHLLITYSGSTVFDSDIVGGASMITLRKPGTGNYIFTFSKSGCMSSTSMSISYSTLISSHNSSTNALEGTVYQIGQIQTPAVFLYGPNIELGSTFSFTSSASFCFDNNAPYASTLRYTTDGSDPSRTNGTIISEYGVFSLSQNATIKVISYIETPTGWIDSQIKTCQMTCKVATPTFNFASGTDRQYKDDLIMSCSTPSSVIRYKYSEGSSSVPETPTESSTAFSGTLELAQVALANTNTADGVVKFKVRAFKANCTPSDIATTQYNMKSQITKIQILGSSNGGGASCFRINCIDGNGVFISTLYQTYANGFWIQNPINNLSTFTPSINNSFFAVEWGGGSSLTDRTFKFFGSNNKQIGEDITLNSTLDNIVLSSESSSGDTFIRFEYEADTKKVDYETRIKQ